MLLGTFAFLLGARFVRLLWGDNAYLTLTIVAAGLGLVIWGVVNLLHHMLWRELSAMDPAERQSWQAEDPELDELWQDRPRSGERKDWAWRAYRIGWGVMAVIYPPALTTLVRTGRLGWDSSFTFVEFLAMLVGVATYIVVGRWRLKRYRCRRCGAVPARLPGGTPRFSCARCGIIWNLGNV